MWTLGRNREKEHARHFLGASKNSLLLEAVIDAVHDLLDGAEVSEVTLSAFRNGLIGGESGTWESTGEWLRKTGSEFASLSSIWEEIAGHPSARIRRRAAAFIHDMPEETASRVAPLLLADTNPKVRLVTAGNLHSTTWKWVTSLLEARLSIESSTLVIESIDQALISIRKY